MKSPLSRVEGIAIPHVEDTAGLVGRVTAGDPSAWSALLHRCEDRLRVLARFRLHKRNAANEDDVLQDTWTQALVSFADFEYRGEGSFLRWLAGILRMKVLEFARGRRKHDHGSLSETSGPGRNPNGRNPDGLYAALVDTQTPSRVAAERDRVQRVAEVLATLPNAEREALFARYYEGLTLREAGAREGVDAATVLHRQRRALARCAKRLEIHR